MMELNAKTLEKLRNIINGDQSQNRADYRSGSKLVEFFNKLGFNDHYCFGGGFPSRWIYTDEKLRTINGTNKLEECIKATFSVINYVDRIEELDDLIKDFNQYLAFDKWSLVRDNDRILFKRLNKVIIESKNNVDTELRESEFLERIFNVDVDSLGLDPNISEIIEQRLKEVEACISNEAPLASIILIGSIMEGMLLGMATTYQQQFNQALSAPKDRNTMKVKAFPNWTLSNYIDVAFEIGLIREDVKKFSHVVRDFRNFIHPYEQMSSHFSPDKQTALICLQVLKAAISQAGEYCQINKGGQLS